MSMQMQPDLMMSQPQTFDGGPLGGAAAAAAAAAANDVMMMGGVSTGNGQSSPAAVSQRMLRLDRVAMQLAAGGGGDSAATAAAAEQRSVVGMMTSQQANNAAAASTLHGCTATTSGTSTSSACNHEHQALAGRFAPHPLLCHAFHLHHPITQTATRCPPPMLRRLRPRLLHLFSLLKFLLVFAISVSCQPHVESHLGITMTKARYFN